MNDIVDRLRGPAPSIPAMREAADEIVRLRRTLADALETLDKYSHVDMPPNVTGLFIGRFQAALS